MARRPRLPRRRNPRRRRDASKRFLIASTALSALLAGGAIAIGAGDDDPEPDTAEAPVGERPDDDTEASDPVPEEPLPGVTCPDAVGDIEALRICLEPFVVRVDTPVARGTGFVLDTGEVITAAHVVEPFNLVDLSFVDGRTVRGVEVVGVDLIDDVALLAPIDSTAGGVELVPGWELSQAVEGSDVFHVGYPGGALDEPTVLTVTQGILSRVRRLPEFDRVLLQSDATAVGGQSGGPFVDATGRVLGMSDLGIGSAASFSTSVTDVIEALERIRAGTSPVAQRLPRPGDGEAGDVSLTVSGSDATRRVAIPAEPRDREMSITFDGVGDFAFVVMTLDGVAIAQNEEWQDEWSWWYGDFTYGFESDGWYKSLEGDPDPLRDDDGTYVVEIPADELVIVEMTRGRAGTLEVAIDVPFVEIDEFTEGDPLEVGDDVVGIVGGLVTATVHELELERGDEITIRLDSPGLLASFDLLTPSDDISDYVPGFSYFGVEFGWGEQSMEGSYEILRSGTYRVVVQGESAFQYHLSVASAG